MAKKLTRTGYKLKLDKEFDGDRGEELQAIGTLVRVMTSGDIQIPLTDLDAYPADMPVIRRITHWLADLFNTKYGGGDFSATELQVPVELGLAVGRHHIILALGDTPEVPTQSRVIFDD